MAPAAGKRAMTFADLERMKRVSDPQISATGKWVMFSVTEVSLQKNSRVNHLWVVPMGGELMSQKRDMGAPAGGRAGASASMEARADVGVAGGGAVDFLERRLTYTKEGESGGRFSPDGKRVLFVRDAEAGSQIWLAPWDDAAGTMGQAERLTSVSTQADGAVWSPDSRRMLFVSRVYPECSDPKGGGAAMWVEEDRCDREKDEAAKANPVKAQVWDHLLYRHWNGYVGEKRSHVLVVSASAGGEVRDLTPRRVIGDAEAPTFSLGGSMEYAWAPDSKEIAYVTNLDRVPAASTNNDVFTLRLDEAGAKPVKVSTSLGSDDGPAYSPDGRWLAFRSQARAGYESDLFRLILFDRSTKTAIEPMKGVMNRWVDEFAWFADSQHIGFISGLEGEAPYAEVSVDTRQRDFFRTRTDLQGEFSDLHTLANGAILATRITVNRPSEIVTVAAPVDRSARSFADAALSTITHLNDDVVASLDLPSMESFWFVGAESANVQGFVVRPPNFDPAKKYPMKFLIHGGPQGAWGDSWSYRWNAELMAASGYVVVMVNPRGSTGYGQAFVDGVNGVGRRMLT